MTASVPKDNEVDEKVIPEGAVAVVSGVWSIMWAGDRSVAHVATKHNLAIGDYLYSPATVAELRAEVAENEAVINVWRRRCEAAERRVGELLDVVKYAVGNPEFNSQQFVYMCKSALANSATLTGADPT